MGPFHLPELRHLLPIALAWGFAVVVMVAEKDLGSSLLFFTLFVVMMWVSTERASYLVIGLLLFSGAAYVAWRLFDHVKTRVAIWRNPWPQYEGKGYQIVQAMFAFANGGTGGTGLGLGSPNKIPVAKTDFIFAAIGEELGLLGTTAILSGFLLMIGSGLRVRDPSRSAIREVARHRSHDDRRHAGVHHHRRRHRVVPLTGIALAVRQLRRLEPVGQLRAAGAVGPRQRLDRAPSRRDTE